MNGNVELEKHLGAVQQISTLLAVSPSPKLRRWGVGVAAGVTALGTAFDLYDSYRTPANHAWNIVFEQNSLAGLRFTQWLAERNPNMFPHSELSTDLGMLNASDLEVRPVMEDGDSVVWKWEGHRYYLTKIPSGGGEQDRWGRRERSGKLQVSGDSKKSRVAFLKLVTHLAKRVEKPMLFTDGWEGWSARNPLSTRNLDTVVLDEGVKENLVADIDNFLSAAEVYGKLGMPYHRGYMLYGPPGTGKTSLALALANYFKKNIYYLSLSSLSSDSTAMNIIGDVPGGSILLLEDIDALTVTHNRSEESTAQVVVQDGDSKKPTLSGIMNALDGMVTPDGIIVIMTTNHHERLDPALVRAGRIDYHAKIGYATTAQVAKLVSTFLPEGGVLPRGWEIRDDVTPAQIMEIVKTEILRVPQVDVVKRIADTFGKQS